MDGGGNLGGGQGQGKGGQFPPCRPLEPTMTYWASGRITSYSSPLFQWSTQFFSICLHKMPLNRIHTCKIHRLESFSSSRNVHTPNSLLRTLHWLPFQQRTHYKLATLTYEARARLSKRSYFSLHLGDQNVVAIGVSYTPGGTVDQNERH